MPVPPPPLPNVSGEKVCDTVPVPPPPLPLPPRNRTPRGKGRGSGKERRKGRKGGRKENRMKNKKEKKKKETERARQHQADRQNAVGQKQEKETRMMMIYMNELLYDSELFFPLVCEFWVWKV